MKMPDSYLLMGEDETVYVDGGYYATKSHYYNSGAEAYYDCSSIARNLRIQAGCVAVIATEVGFAVGQIFGAIIGAMGGLLAGSVIWSFANAWDNAAMDAKNWPRTARGCLATEEICGLTMRVTIS